MDFVTVFILYIMLGVPFAVWSGRASRASAQASANGLPGRGATIFLLVLPLAFIAWYALSGIGAVTSETVNIGVGSAQLREPASEWGAYAFLALSPASGMVLGYLTTWGMRPGAGGGTRWGRGQE